MRKAIAIAVLSLVLTQCGQVKTLVDGFKYANAVASALEQEMGAKPQVGFNWHNGRLLSGTTQFPDFYQRNPLRRTRREGARRR